MTHIDRRTFLALAASASCARAASSAASLTIHPETTLNELPLSYNGFSIETATLENPEVYHPANRTLVALFRRLSPHGVLRLGGNSSEFCWWKANDSAQPPQVKVVGQGRSDNWMPQKFHAITPRSVDNLRDFLDATGWTCIYGLNFGTGSPERDAGEAAYVARALGPKLRYFQIGNEPDFYRAPNNLLRAAGWDFPDYLDEWMAIARAIIGAVPDARFGGPDVGSSADWVVRFGERASALLGERLVELSGHYYAEGPPDSPQANIDNLLAPDPRIAERMDAIMPVARARGLDFRMSEGNSCYRGGKAGMSNALAGALWGMDYMLEMAARGCRGINFHGGGGGEISSALGDKLPGARDARDLEIARLGTFYSPVAGNPSVGYRARPLFYAMMAVETLAGARLVKTEFDTRGANATAYAGIRDGAWRVALVNKEAHRDLDVSIELPEKSAAAHAWRLAGPALDAIDGITLAGAQVAAGDAQWQPRPESLRTSAGRVVFHLPRASAAVIFTGAAR
jgi:hypothetical protein